MSVVVSCQEVDALLSTGKEGASGVYIAMCQPQVSPLAATSDEPCCCHSESRICASAASMMLDR